YLVKSSIVRMQTSRNLRTNIIAKQKREIGDLLAAEKHELAKIKCDAMIREECFVEAYDILETYLERIQASMYLIHPDKHTKTPPDAIEDSLRSVVWAAPYAENK
ncbi:hypothetical protein KIPB_013365, partial [Kipferlia bialata]